MTSGAVLRWVRALTLPTVLFTSALAGHAAGDGVTPAVSALIALFGSPDRVAHSPLSLQPSRPCAAARRQDCSCALQLLVWDRRSPPDTMVGGHRATVAPMMHSTSHDAWFCRAPIGGGTG